MKNLFSLLLLFANIYIFAQIGIGTSTPRGALDINSPTESIAGLVLPSNLDATNIKNPETNNNPVPGTIFYDIKNSCIRLYKQTNTWSDCFCEDCSEPINPTIPIITP
ncbi:hypothetical protein [Chishuiella changwenlii]|uniref:hypothetical protein n=1 Tax=Chishuiella changwenlii TaxID=1434701 RepID=UPI002FDA8294